MGTSHQCGPCFTYEQKVHMNLVLQFQTFPIPLGNLYLML